MLVCSGGMSTSLLVNIMNEEVKKYDEEIEIFASPEAEAQKMIEQVDVVLLGPQVFYIVSEFKEFARPFNIPIAVIDAIDYGRMDGEKVLKMGLQLINENRKETGKNE